MIAKHALPAAAVISLLSGAALADTAVTFEDGAEGWSGPSGFGGSTVIDADGGNPGANLHTTFNDFGITFRNSTNPEFVGDLTQSGVLTFSIDVKVEKLDFLGQPTPRPWVIEIRNADLADGTPYPWVSVWHTFTWISAAEHGDWTTFTVELDPMAAELPAGWGGTGDEGPFGEPLLPEGVTVADVLSNVTEFTFTTFQPGYFFSSSDYDVRLDNIMIGGSATGCVGDTDASGDVGFGDLVTLLATWGPCPGCPADFNGNDVVDFDDLVSLLANWGPCP